MRRKKTCTTGFFMRGLSKGNKFGQKPGFFFGADRFHIGQAAIGLNNIRHMAAMANGKKEGIFTKKVEKASGQKC